MNSRRMLVLAVVLFIAGFAGVLLAGLGLTPASRDLSASELDTVFGGGNCPREVQNECNTAESSCFNNGCVNVNNSQVCGVSSTLQQVEVVNRFWLSCFSDADSNADFAFCSTPIPVPLPGSYYCARQAACTAGTACNFVKFGAGGFWICPPATGYTPANGKSFYSRASGQGPCPPGS